MEKLVKFIKENKLSFTGVGSELNSDCCIISGYADYCGITESEEIEEAIKKAHHRAILSDDLKKELERVFEFAYGYNYGNYWKTDDAKLMYKF